MRYFIDFEAAQYTQEIIAVGCIREDGKRFYSLVRPKELKKVTDFIVKLTGITKEMLEEAKSSDVVFEEFFDWVSTDKGYAKFYCYSNSDKLFLQRNLKGRTSTLKAQMALSLILANLKDYSINVKEHFGLATDVALKKVMDYYYPDNTYECHNALADAEMLYHVYRGVKGEKEVKGVPFPEYMPVKEHRFEKESDFDGFEIELWFDGKCEKTYKSFQGARKFVFKKLKEQKINPSESAVNEKLMYVINKKRKYYGFLWIAKEKKEK